MKTKTLILIFAIMIGNFSCSKTSIENQIPDDYILNKRTLLTIESVIPNEIYYTETIKMTEKLKAKGYTANMNESLIVEYQEMPLVSVTTPLYHSLKNSLEVFHLFFIIDSIALEHELLVYEEFIDEDIKSLIFKSIDEESLLQIYYSISDGNIIGEPIVFESAWWERFNDCLDWVVGQMSGLDFAACMIMPKTCFGMIVSFCAFAATEEIPLE